MNRFLFFLLVKSRLAGYCDISERKQVCRISYCKSFWFSVCFMTLLGTTEVVLSDLKMAHEQQRKSLEEEFEKLRLSLQVEKLLLLFKRI